MKYIKVVMYAILSFVFSCWLFDSSILAMIFIFCALNSIELTSKRDFKTAQKTKGIRIALIACACGIALIVLGNLVFNNNIMIMVGALVFAPTFAALLIREGIVLIGYFTKK